MDEGVKSFVKKMGILINKLKPFIMIAFLVFAIIGITNFAKYVKLQPEIKEKCGWENEAVKCFCEKKTFYEMEAYYKDNDGKIELEYIGNESYDGP